MSCTRGRFFYAQKKRRPIETCVKRTAQGPEWPSARVLVWAAAAKKEPRTKDADLEAVRVVRMAPAPPKESKIMREDYDTNPDAADQGECGTCGKQGAGA